MLTLKELLGNPSVRSEILQDKVTGENLNDISDGSYVSSHSFFLSNPSALQIIAYYDKVETCNPLGSSSKKYKLGCIFFTLGNIKPLLRSNLKSLFLLALAKSTTIKNNGIDSILKPFIDDLKVLSSSGIKLTTEGKVEVWKGTLVAFVADNLAAHEIGGFKQSFSFAHRFCRSCMATKASMKTYFDESNFELRTSSTHRRQCTEIEGPNQHSASVEYGINRRAALEDLPGFSVVDCLPHDVMHDLMEGLVPNEMQFLLQHYIAKGVF